MSEPSYKHDCEKCEYLGTITDHWGNILDGYYCAKAEPFPSIIARSSNEPSDYVSSPIFKELNLYDPRLNYFYLVKQIKGKINEK